MDPRTSRGFLNNNPGNMDRSADNWQGEIKDAKDARLTDFQRHELVAGRFCVFVSAEWGIRAMAKNLMAYHDGFGCESITDYINRWAPPNENATGSYIQAVCEHTGHQPGEWVDIRDYVTLYAIVDAIIRVECGGMPYAGKEIEDGLRLAGVVKPATAQHSVTMKGAYTAAAATAAQPMLAAIQDPIQQVADTLAPMAGSSRYVDMTIVGLKVALAVVALWGVYMVLRERKMRAQRDQAVATAQEAGL